MSLNIKALGGFVPQIGVAFGEMDGDPTAVTAGNPLPVMPRVAGASSAAIAGSVATTRTVGPFTPDLGRAIWLTLSGSWTGSVQLQWSTDGGATKLPLTYGDGGIKPGWVTNLNAPVAEEMVAGATYFLAITLSAGSVTYRMEQ